MYFPDNPALEKPVCTTRASTVKDPEGDLGESDKAHMCGNTVTDTTGEQRKEERLA